MSTFNPEEYSDLSEGDDVLKSAMAKRKDDAHDADSDEISRARRDWETFQTLSVEESKAMGGSEATTHLVKGLDVELLRRQRERLNESTETTELEPVREKSPDKIAKTAMGQSVLDVLFNPAKPHPHNIHFREMLDNIINSISSLGLHEKMPGSSDYFEYGRSKYVFRSDSEAPVVVMKSLADIEEERSNTKNAKYLHRMSPDLIREIGDALKRSKRAKKEKKQGKNVFMSRAPVAVDEDMDIFGGFTVSEPSKSSAAMDHTGPLFTTPSPAISTDPTAQIQAALAQRQQLKQQQVAAVNKRVEADEDEYGIQSKSRFGERLDVSQFGSVEDGNKLSQSKQKRQKRGEEKQLLNAVMKKMDKLDR